MSRVLSLSLTDELYKRVSEMAASLGMTIYQYVRMAIETMAYEDECMSLLDPDEYDRLKPGENDG